MFLWKVFLLQNCESNNLSDCADVLSRLLSCRGSIPKLKVSFHNFQIGFYKNPHISRSPGWPHSNQDKIPCDFPVFQTFFLCFFGLKI